ncbi:MAG: hypothetical protein IT450_03530 [Phycisphaerales bacterium]|nr:hypothetical protein [Phycisphaerales bacterium]
MTFWKPDYECDYFSLWEAWSPAPPDPYDPHTVSFFVRSGIHFQYGDVTGWSGIVTGPQYFVADDVYGCWELEPGTILLPAAPYGYELNNYYLYFPCDTPAPPSVAPERAPAQDDRTFIYDPYWPEAYSHDTLEFDIPVTRYAGATNSAGTLQNVSTLLDNGLIGEYATLTLMCWDVDSDTPADGLSLPEMDRVYFNGELVGSLDPGNAQFLEGCDGQWRLNKFRIPIDRVRFPSAPGHGGSAPTAQVNSIRIEVDTGNTRLWYKMAVDWASLEIEVMSPVVLIHGINQTPNTFFDPMGLPDYLRLTGLCVDNSILLADPQENPKENRVGEDGVDLSYELPRRAAQFGVDSIHLVAHSKGGLDCRAYLADLYEKRPANFSVLSLTTLSTPHEGSVLADLVVANQAVVEKAIETECLDIPDFADTLRFIMGMFSVTKSPGYVDLTTDSAASFNRRNIPNLPSSITYNSVSADADRNLNGRIDRQPDEFRALRVLDPFLEMPDGTDIVDLMYQTINQNSTVTFMLVPDPEGSSEFVALVMGIPTASAKPNDTFVSIRSGRGISSFDALVTNRYMFVGAEGRTHGDIADPGVGQTVIPWLRDVESSTGDLKPR